MEKEEKKLMLINYIDLAFKQDFFDQNEFLYLLYQTNKDLNIIDMLIYKIEKITFEQITATRIKLLFLVIYYIAKEQIDRQKQLQIVQIFKDVQSQQKTIRQKQSIDQLKIYINQNFQDLVKSQHIQNIPEELQILTEKTITNKILKNIAFIHGSNLQQYQLLQNLILFGINMFQIQNNFVEIIFWEYKYFQKCLFFNLLIQAYLGCRFGFTLEKSYQRFCLLKKVKDRQKDVKENILYILQPIQEFFQESLSKEIRYYFNLMTKIIIQFDKQNKVDENALNSNIYQLLKRTLDYFFANFQQANSKENFDEYVKFQVNGNGQNVYLWQYILQNFLQFESKILYQKTKDAYIKYFMIKEILERLQLNDIQYNIKDLKLISITKIKQQLQGICIEKIKHSQDFITEQSKENQTVNVIQQQNKTQNEYQEKFQALILKNLELKKMSMKQNQEIREKNTQNNHSKKLQNTVILNNIINEDKKFINFLNIL